MGDPYHAINNPQPFGAKLIALVLLMTTMLMSWFAHAGNVVTSTGGTFSLYDDFEENVQIGTFDTTQLGQNSGIFNGGTCAIFKCAN